LDGVGKGWDGRRSRLKKGKGLNTETLEEVGAGRGTKKRGSERRDPEDADRSCLAKDSGER
jgi:hypothetical protein